MPAQRLGQAALERSRRAWWTVYALEREMTSLGGLPQSIHDDDITVPLPASTDSTQETMAIALRIQLLRVMNKINRSMNLSFYPCYHVNVHY